MSRSARSNGCTWEHDGPSQRGLYRDRENGWIFGVCAGLAEYIGVRTLAVRIAVTLSLLFLFVPTALAYLAATVLLRSRPLTYCGRRAEHDFWRARHREDHWRAS